jgi:hypothetical protein
MMEIVCAGATRLSTLHDGNTQAAPGAARTGTHTCTVTVGGRDGGTCERKPGSEIHVPVGIQGEFMGEWVGEWRGCVKRVSL